MTTPAKPLECPKCASREITKLPGGEFVCASCGHRWALTVGDLIDTPEYQDMLRGLQLQRFHDTLGVNPPRVETLDAAIAGLSERRARARLARVEATLAVLERVRELVIGAMRPTWRLDPDHPDYDPEP